MTAKTKGGVLSGIPTQTTAGNTIREIWKGMYIKNLLGIPYNDNKFMTVNAGDDAIFIMSEKFIRKNEEGYSPFQKVLS